jgi:hypothetical protein
MRIAKIVLVLLGAIALAGCIVHPGRLSTGVTVDVDDGHHGGHHPGRGRK